jgi:hypothetical protein
MEQITLTREALEQFPTNVLVDLLLRCQENKPTLVVTKEIHPLAIETNNSLLSLFPAETHVKPQNTDKRWSNRDDLNLIYGYSKGHLSDKALAEMLQRTVSSVTNRIRRLKAAGKL